MMSRRATLAGLTVALALGAWAPAPGVAARADLPARLTDVEFWGLVADFSEPNGFFRSDNLVSNEDTLQVVIPQLLRTVKPGGVYLGVGPDQNFTYLAALQPKIAFITDIRRGNLHAHLMYKALFELSADRAEFLSRLFSRARPAGVGATSTADELFAAYANAAPSQALYAQNAQAIKTLLIKRHGFTLSDEDQAGIEYVAGSFYGAGPFLAYASGPAPFAGGRGGGRYPTYQDLQTGHDGQGRNRAYLASEDSFRVVKALEERNLIVPLVGDFAGAKALLMVGTYLKARGATVTVFYTSNVEQYLFGDGLWNNFARNVAALPLDETSTFIRSCFNNCQSPYPSRAVMLLDSMTGLLRDFRAGRIRAYGDVLSHGRQWP
jgi:hypothetical protein